MNLERSAMKEAKSSDSGILGSFSEALSGSLEDMRKAYVAVTLNAKTDMALDVLPKGGEMRSDDGKLTALYFGNLNAQMSEEKNTLAKAS